MGWSPRTSVAPPNRPAVARPSTWSSGSPQDAVGERIAGRRLGGQAQTAACRHGQREDVDPIIDQADRGARAGGRAPPRPGGLVDVDRGHPLGEAPDARPAAQVNSWSTGSRWM